MTTPAAPGPPSAAQIAYDAVRRTITAYPPPAGPGAAAANARLWRTADAILDALRAAGRITDPDRPGDTPIVWCAACGDLVPDGTPPYAADLRGNGRHCAACERGAGGARDLSDRARCPVCTVLFLPHEVADHRKLAHPVSRGVAPPTTTGEQDA